MAGVATEEEETKVTGAEPWMVVEGQHALGEIKTRGLHVQGRGTMTTMPSAPFGIHEPLAFDAGPEHPL
jgi:hypothetical protein